MQLSSNVSSLRVQTAETISQLPDFSSLWNQVSICRYFINCKSMFKHYIESTFITKFHTLILNGGLMCYSRNPLFKCVCFWALNQSDSYSQCQRQ